MDFMEKVWIYFKLDQNQVINWPLVVEKIQAMIYLVELLVPTAAHSLLSQATN